MPPRTAALTLVTAAALGVGAQYLFVRQVVGLNLLVATILLLAAAWRTRPRRGLSKIDLVLPAGAIAFAALGAIRVDAPLVVFDILAALALSIGSAVVFRGVSLLRMPLHTLLRAGLDAGATTLGGGASVVRDGTPGLGALLPARSSRGVAQLGGVALATPFLVVFAVLFSSADAVFRHLVEGAIDADELRRLYAELPIRTFVAAVAAWIAAGVLRSVTTGASADRGLRGLFASDVAMTMLVAIDALFAVFVTLQVTYLFGGRDTLDAAGVSYSAYGRAGFFELVAVATLVAGLLFALDVFVGGRGRGYVLAALSLVALTCVVLASATLRMQLYQDAYGWSELRLYAFAAIAFIFLALGLLAWSIVRDTTRFALQRLALAGLAVALVVNVIGPSSFVARRNIERVINPDALPADASRALDVAYLMTLGEGALPTIDELSALVPEPDRSVLTDALRVATTRRGEPRGWQSWNFDREGARSIVVRAGAVGGGRIR